MTQNSFDGRYITYPCFRKGWWAYRRTYHPMSERTGMLNTQGKVLASNIKAHVAEV
jgi:hypothetical protein